MWFNFCESAHTDTQPYSCKHEWWCMCTESVFIDRGRRFAISKASHPRWPTSETIPPDWPPPSSRKMMESNGRPCYAFQGSLFLQGLEFPDVIKRKSLPWEKRPVKSASSSLPDSTAIVFWYKWGETNLIAMKTGINTDKKRHKNILCGKNARNANRINRSINQSINLAINQSNKGLTPKTPMAISQAINQAI